MKKKKTFSLFCIILLCLQSLTVIGQSAVFQEPLKPLAFEKDKIYTAVISTSKGEVTCLLYPDKAPISVTNFIQLARGGFYEGLVFDQEFPDYLISVQGEDSEKPARLEYTLPAEIELKHGAGAVAWTRVPGSLNPYKRSHASRFYITYDSLPFLDGEHTVFGQVLTGMDVVHSIRQGDKITKIEIVIKDKLDGI